MPPLIDAAKAHATFRARLARAAAREATSIWRKQVEPGRIQQSWLTAAARVLVLLTGAQRVVAQQADSYLDTALDLQDVDPQALGRVQPAAFSGIASDGRDLQTLLHQPAITALTAIKRGSTVDRALALGQAHLDMIVQTQVADAGRVADEVAIAARPEANGWVRMITPPACSRCAILAGRFYRWNTGFERHPSCHCVHIPAHEDVEGDIRTDPKAYFESLSPAEQDRVFTKAGAEAVRLGADLAQVVNARRGVRGMATASRITAAEVKVLRGGRSRGRAESTNVFGRDLLVTTEGTTTRGLAGQRLGARESGAKLPGARYRSAKAPRLMPEQILQTAGGDRDEAARLLFRNGYLLEKTARSAPRPAARRPAAPDATTESQPAPATPAPPTRRTFDDRVAGAATGQAALSAAPRGLHREQSGLTPAQASALTEYQDGYRPGFRGINATLRGSRPSDDATQAAITAIDSAMAESPLTTDVVTYRGVRDARLMFGDRMAGNLTGLRWREDAYVSTAADPSAVEAFSGGNDALRMRILAPRGSQAIDLGDPDDPGEAELLLARGLEFIVVADHGLVDGVRRVDVELAAR
jgi:hypothetical protein